MKSGFRFAILLFIVPGAIACVNALSAPLSVAGVLSERAMSAAVRAVFIGAAAVVAAASFIIKQFDFIPPAILSAGAAVFIIVFAWRLKMRGITPRSKRMLLSIAAAAGWCAACAFQFGAYGLLSGRLIAAGLIAAVGAACVAVAVFGRKKGWSPGKVFAVGVAMQFAAGAVCAGVFAARQFNTEFRPERGAEVIYRGGAYGAASLGGGRFLVSAQDRDVYMQEIERGRIVKSSAIKGIKGKRAFGKPELFVADAARGNFFLASKSWKLKNTPNLFRLDAADGHVSGRIVSPRTGYIISAALDAKRRRLYAINEFGKTLFVFDADTMRRVKEIRFERAARPVWPYKVAVDERSGRVFISGDLLSSRLWAVSPESGKVRVRGGFAGMGLAVDGRRGLLYVARPLAGRVDAVDMGSLKTVAAMRAGAGTRELCIDERRGLLFAGDFLEGTVSVFDLDSRKKTRTLRPGAFPRGMHCDAGHGILAVAAGRAAVAYEY